MTAMQALALCCVDQQATDMNANLRLSRLSEWLKVRTKV